MSSGTLVQLSKTIKEYSCQMALVSVWRSTKKARKYLLTLSNFTVDTGLMGFSDMDSMSRSVGTIQNMSFPCMKALLRTLVVAMGYFCN